MVAKGGRAEVRLSPRKPSQKWKTVTRGFQKRYKEVVKQVERKGLKFVRFNVPVSTGRLRDSFTSHSSVTAQMKGKVVIESPLDYAKFMNQGTAPSLGAYIPRLGRRIRTGIHPGVRGTRYLEKTGVQMQRETNTRLKRLNKDVNKLVKRHYPRNKKGAIVKGT